MQAGLRKDLERIGLAAWTSDLEALLARRLANDAHGDMPRWRQAIGRLPEVTDRAAALDKDIVVICEQPLQGGECVTARDALLSLAPWRKGPFDVGGIRIDSEWRSDLKWQRVVAGIQSLEGRRVLDVGCGNGYYALRMLGAGAECVIGVDPTLLFIMQFTALRHFLPELPVHLLPLRSSELPGPGRAFDTVFSMGVLYHQRSPLDHLRELRGQLRAGGELVLETLVLPGDEAFARTPADRYARMRNVWLLPTVAELSTWLHRSGFEQVRCTDVTRTGCDEQRSTEWMTFDSLRAALDPDNADLTVEGWPAPLRAILVARLP